MALIRVDADVTGLSGLAGLGAALARLPRAASVTIMTHGLRFDPADPEHDPHTHILSFTPRACWKAVSWPRHLHLDRQADRLGIAFGWPARGALPAVAARAFDAGAAMGRLIQEIRRRRPDLKVNIIAHSLGVRVALTAVAALPPGAVHRLILLSGAEYLATAAAAFAHAAPGGTRVLNVGSGENAVFDGLFRLCVPAPLRDDRTVAAGLPDRPGWTDLRVDNAGHRQVLRDIGVRTRAPVTRVCHWSTYLRPGLFALYRRVLDPDAPGFLTRLDAALHAAGRPGRRDAGVMGVVAGAVMPTLLRP